MKKKAIEKVPYLTGEKCSKSSMKFVAAVEIKDIDHEQHLLLEIYENKKKSLGVPVVRFAYTKSDWGNYDPKKGKWSASSISNDYNRAIWNRDTRRDDMETYISEADIEKIRRFTKKKIWSEEHWWEYLKKLEREIRHTRQKKCWDRRKQRLNERCAAVGKLPEDFGNWYKGELFAGENYIYYKRKGRYATFWCSHCGRNYKRATEALDTFEGQFETVVAVPKRGDRAKCELCGAKGVYKTAGTMRSVYGLTKMCYVGQRYKGTGVVSRYIQVEKILKIGEPEQFIVTEIARSFLEKGEKRIKDYQFYNGWTGKEEWCDHNIGGIGAQVHEDAGYIYPGTYEELKETDFKYCALREYMHEYDKVTLPEYLELYDKYKSIEMLVKMGAHRSVTELIEAPWTRKAYIKNKEAVTIAGMFGIRSEHKKQFVESEGNYRFIELLQIEKELNATWTDEQCEKLSIISPGKQKLELALRYMTLQKFLNRIEKYAGAELGEGMCEYAMARAIHISATYLDYLSMRNSLGYDLRNTVYLYPRDLEAAHQKMIMESQKEEADKRTREVAEKYPDIKKKYRSLRKKYYYEDENMVIRPARSAEEIVEEGKILHHCVGSDEYLRKHNDGESVILMLRFKTEPNIPYITVEIKETRIIQWYGAYDKKPDKENMQNWIDTYVTRLKHNEKTNQRTKYTEILTAAV